MKHTILILLILFLTARIGYSQQIDTSLVLKNLKIRLLPELQLGLLSESALNDYSNRELKVSVLKSKGFEKIIFFKVSSGQVLASDTIKEQKKIIFYLMSGNFENGEECYFVYAYNKINNEFYRLNGTKVNDFFQLYNTMNQWYWKTPTRIKRSTINHFKEDYWVEELDLECLLRSLTGKQGYCLDYCPHELIVFDKMD